MEDVSANDNNVRANDTQNVRANDYSPLRELEQLIKQHGPQAVLDALMIVLEKEEAYGLSNN